jgi:alkylhydroperoxidase family enzyme
MINSYNQFAKAVSALYPTVTNLHGEVAYDDNGNEVVYSKTAVEAKIAKITAQEASVSQSAFAKLKAIGLTDEEIAAITK